MFHLGSPDVLPVGDLGVRKGMQALYGLKVGIHLVHLGCWWRQGAPKVPAARFRKPSGGSGCWGLPPAGAAGPRSHGARGRAVEALQVAGQLLHGELAGGRAAWWLAGGPCCRWVPGGSPAALPVWVQWKVEAPRAANGTKSKKKGNKS
jgi:hypothetical protein